MYKNLSKKFLIFKNYMPESKIKNNESKNHIIITEQEVYEFHSAGQKGKIHMGLNKQLQNKRDLSIAYSPGVGYPCLAIQKNPDLAYEYTAKGNFVAVISNGTAVLGLGNLGAMASKPVMEGKSALFKKFADIDSVDIEIDSTNTEDIIRTIRNIGETWGGINLEDIAAPECFVIERELKKQLNIPVFHDDQHGTAIISMAGLMNALEIVGKKVGDIKVVVSGAGAAGLSCISLMHLYGIKHDNILVCDRNGVVYEGRTQDMNEWKMPFAVKTDKRTMKEALQGADVFFGLSVKGALTKDMIKDMAKDPIIFALANPDPEITQEDAIEARPDCIIATGRSDYPNQINNVICFPYIFRGAIDVGACKITDNMKLAASKAIADLTKQPVPDEIKALYPGIDLNFGRQYIVPTPFDHRLIAKVSSAVAKAAIDEGVARKSISDWNEYESSLMARINPNSHLTNLLFESIDISQKIIGFADGEEPRAINAAVLWRDSGRGTAVLIGREEKINNYCNEYKIKLHNINIVNASTKKDELEKYIEYFYKKEQRNSLTHRECESLVKTDANIFGALLLEFNEINGLITGLKKNANHTVKSIEKIISGGEDSIGVSVVLSKNKLLFIGDTSAHAVNNCYGYEKLVKSTNLIANFVKKVGISPKIAFISPSNFSSPNSQITQSIKKAMMQLENEKFSFEYDGDMMPSMALDYAILKEKYPFTKLTSEPNILIMPTSEFAILSVDLIKSIDKTATVIGSILLGMEKSVQICNPESSAKDLFNLGVVATI